MSESSTIAEAELAIVIPAYKAKYLRTALESIVGQTDRRFQVYVGDDGSPEDIAGIVRGFTGLLPLTYHRFENNLGGKSLVKQWDRCLRLTHEPWIWLFSDDDFMDENCVAAFYAERTRTQEKHDLYRFDTIWVNGQSEPILNSPRHPVEETGAEFLLARLAGTRNSTLQEIIFSRRAWAAGGGIPVFPLAWCSDDAFIAGLGAQRSIRTIVGPPVYWRLSELNISNNKSRFTIRTKITASADFVRWVMAYFDQYAPAARAEAARQTERWFLNYISTCWQFLDLKSGWEFEKVARVCWNHPPGWAGLKSLGLNFKLASGKIRNRWRGKKHAENSLSDKS
jgi:hypothetical protein